MPTAYITKIVQFNAAHRLHSPKLTNEENLKIYDKCNNKNGHGHNYRLEVTLKGSIDPVTGMVANLTDVKKIIEQEICERFDHTHLNHDNNYFKDLVPTVENIAIVCWDLLSQTALNTLLYKLTLHETETNYCTYYG